MHAEVSLSLQGVLPEAWPDLLRTLAAFLCPFKAMQQRQQRDAAATAAGVDAAEGAAPRATPAAAATATGAAAVPSSHPASSRATAVAASSHSRVLGRGLSRYNQGNLKAGSSQQLSLFHLLGVLQEGREHFIRDMHTETAVTLALMLIDNRHGRQKLAFLDWLLAGLHHNEHSTQHQQLLLPMMP